MATGPNKSALAGRRILVCRPARKAAETCSALREAGADARAMPMLSIEPRELDGRDRSLLQHLDHYQKVIAVSPSAAQLLLEQLDQWWPQWPVGIEWWGPGPGTAEVFGNAGLSGRFPTGGHDTEALLAEPAFDNENLRQQRVLVARGESGREALIEGLNARGARTAILSLYQRRAVEWDQDTVERTFREFDPDTIVALSGDTLKNLMELVHNTSEVLAHRRLVVPVARIALWARDAGFDDVQVPKNLSPIGLVDECAAGTQLSGVTDSRER